MNLIHIWWNMDQIRIGLHDMRSLTNNGRSGFIRLAIHILSIVPNSAATERLFSQFGIIHSKLRNRLSVEKVRKQALVRSDTITQHGFLRGAKRKFIEIDEDDAPPQNSNSRTSIACSTATDLILATPLRRSIPSAAIPSPSCSTSQSRSRPGLPSDSRTQKHSTSANKPTPVQCCTVLYKVTGPTGRYLLLQSFTGLYSPSHFPNVL